MEFILWKKVYLLSNDDVQTALERALERRLLLSDYAVDVAQQLQILGDDRHVQKRLYDHVEILRLVGVPVQFSA